MWANVRQWLSRPVGRGLLFGLFLLACALPAWLMAQPLIHYRIQADDFYHFGDSRTWERTFSNLIRPHNLHVVATFRLVNGLVFWMAGGWHSLPRVAAIAVYLILLLTMIASGWLIRVESGCDMLGLASMVAIGCSTLLYSAVTFYAASPALLAGLGILLTLVALQRWRRNGGAGALVAAAAASVFAIGSWSGGYVVVPVAAVYLWADGRSHCRRAAVWFVLGIGAVCGGLIMWTSRGIFAAQNLGGRGAGEALRPWRGIVHTVHAIPEMLVLRNLGIQAEIAESQAAVMCALLLGMWTWYHLRGVRIAPLEAAGATLVLVSYLLIYTARGYLPFASLRTTPWYQTLPQIGFVVFAGGLLARGAPVPGARHVANMGSVLAIVAFGVVVCALQKPLADRLFLEEVFPSLSAREAESLPLPASLPQQMAGEVARLSASEQARVLDQFDRIEAASRQFGISAGTLEESFGKPSFPSIPTELNPWTILRLAPEPGAAEATAVREALGWIRDVPPATHLAVRPLIESLENPDAQTRVAATIALGLLGPSATPAVPVLVNRLKDPDPYTHRITGMALKRIDARAADQLGIE
jgi:hypothetical protein